MNIQLYLLIILIPVAGNSFSYSDPVIDSLFTDYQKQCQDVISAYDQEYDVLNLEYEILHVQLKHAVNRSDSLDIRLSLVELSQRKVEMFKKLEADVSKIRYIKGLQIIRILYEKVLSLDHHFASVATFGEINRLSNPNQYAEWGEVTAYVSDKTDDRDKLNLSPLLGSNLVVSVISTFSNLLRSDLKKEEKEASLKKVECVLDFTLRMQNDLNTIYYETTYLQESNNHIKTAIEQLFSDYTGPMGYQTDLSTCRSNDDWGRLRDNLNDYMTKMESESNPRKKFRMRVNIEFPIDRLLQFINQYNDFILDGERFYQKFEVILSSYENESACATKLPVEYADLKRDIQISVDKFRIAYKPIEVNGSKLKEILYGLNEYE